MQQQERELITGLFDRLKPFEAQPRDPEADALIAELVRRQPAAPYLLAQTVLVQEQALKAAQERIAELEGNSAGASSGFLSNAPKIGPWGSKPSSAVPQTAAAAAPAMAPPAQPWGAGAGGGGGSFLRTAMVTAAGVAGGALLFQGISGLLNRQPGPFGQSQNQGEQLLGSDDAGPADLAQDSGAADDYDVTDDTSGLDDAGGGEDFT